MTLHGKNGREIAPVFRAAILDMEANPSLYKSMNPGNGYGDSEGILREIRDGAEKHPDAIFTAQ